MTRWLPAALAVSLLSAPVSAGTGTDPIDVAAKPVRVSLFKNGFGLITSRVDLTGSGTYLVTSLPEAAMGTLWLRWPDGVEVSRTVSTLVSAGKRVKATSIEQMLEANIGATVQLEVAGADGSSRLQGRLADYPLVPGTETGQRGRVLLLETEGGTAVIPTASILRLLVTGDSLALESEIVERKPALRLEVQARKGNSALEVDALARGIAWAPSYAVDITGEGDRATVSAKAVIVNDLADMDGVSAELVAGFPHLQFSAVPSAMSLTPLEQILQRLRQAGVSEAGGVMSNVTAQRATFSTGRLMEIGTLPSMPVTPVMGEQSEDLYFYQVEDVTLRKGERGYYPLFRERVPFEHRYSWEIAPVDLTYLQPQPPAEDQEIVWHVLKLTNTTNRPWTTAPASTTKGGRLLGQDTLHYTPPGQSTELRITQALNVQADQNEYESERQRGAAHFYSMRYDLVTIRGKLEVINHTDRAITLVITKQISGEVRQAGGEPEIVKLGTSVHGVNPTTRLTWTTQVEPGRDRRLGLEYTYQAYVRN